MRKRCSLRGEDRGVSLIAVVIIMVVVSVIGTVATKITITNIEMKEIERAGKANFYSAEEITDALSVGLNTYAAEAMRQAYSEVLTDYRNVMVTGKNIQKEFSALYMNSLKAVFQNGGAIQNLTDENGDVSYEVGDFNTDIVKKCLEKEGYSDAQNEAYINAIWREPAAPKYHIDYENGLFILKDLCVRFEDERGYETVIHTDAVFHTPELNFSGSNIIKDFMRYSLIADRQILVNSPNISVDGNVYAGVDGIQGDHGNGEFTGSVIVTRGNITVKPGATITVGSDNSKVWAENAETLGAGDPSCLKLSGTCYIADDLSLNGKNSTVILDGSYYGYNFQDKYTGLRENTDASFSSAIMINGQQSKLDLTGTDYLLLSGRTYISRGSYSGNKDVAMGESLSVRTNQMAYYVPAVFLDTTKTPVDFLVGGAADCSAYMNVSNVESYLKAGEPVAAYHYIENGTDKVAYYLNFASEQSANNFFAAYAAANSDAVFGYANTYVENDALVLNDTLSYSLKGNLLYRQNTDDPLQEQRITITGGWDEGGLFFQYANRLAMNYKSLQLSLEDYNTTVTADNVRFLSGGEVDKSIDPLMGELIDVPALQAMLAGYAGNIRVEDSDASGVIVLADGNYDVPAGYSGGIIIATGNVKLNSHFNGMIISGGTISFGSNVTVTADEIMISRMFSEDMGQADPFFASFFKDYNTFTNSVIGQVEVDRYLTYDNWTKTEE